MDCNHVSNCKYHKKFQVLCVRVCECMHAYIYFLNIWNNLHVYIVIQGHWIKCVKFMCSVILDN
jgi:hypothetical protein